MVTFSDDLNFPLDESFPIYIIPDFFFIKIVATANIDAHIGVGYDTHGLAEAIAPLYQGHDFDVSKVLDGFYIDANTHFHIDGTVGALPGIGLDGPIAAEFEVGGTVTTGVTASLHIPSSGSLSDPSEPDRIRPFAGDLQNVMFDVSGSVKAAISAESKVGVNTPFGFIGFDKSWNFAGDAVQVRQQ